eukprot:15260293-Alexandrium_andersonii.AAC.1
MHDRFQAGARHCPGQGQHLGPPNTHFQAPGGRSCRSELAQASGVIPHQLAHRPVSYTHLTLPTICSV